MGFFSTSDLFRDVQKIEETAVTAGTYRPLARFLRYVPMHAAAAVVYIRLVIADSTFKKRDATCRYLWFGR